MKTNLRWLLEEYAYDMYMWDISREDFDKKLSEYTDLDYNDDFYDMALECGAAYEEEHAKNNSEPDYVWMADHFIECIEDDYNWVMNWEEVDL